MRRTTKLDDPRLAWVQVQSVFGQLRAERGQEPHCLALVLKPKARPA